MKNSLTYLVTVLVMMAIGFYTGILFVQANTEPEIIEVPYIVEVPVCEVVETQVVVCEEREVTEYVEKPVYVYTRDFRQWENLSQFTAWAEDKIAYLLEGDCDDYAENLQLCALCDGYAVSCQMIYNGRIQGVEVSQVKGSHMGNLVMIGNDIYYVEPVPEYFRIIWLCERD